MKDYNYIRNFEKMAFGVFVHFGLYSIAGKGEWYQAVYGVKKEEYSKLMNKFKAKKTWAKDLVSIAKKSGAKYIILGTRHHDGFSLYDTCGLNDFDAPHSATKRDLVKEFVEECNKQGIVPFFYHTLLDWYNDDFKNNFKEYLKYLRKSVEILCTNYGKIGGFWFDGTWSRPDSFEEDELYSLIRKYQKEAIIVNNTGLFERGRTGNPEIDAVTFERGKPIDVDRSKKPIAGEMCQILNDHWGNANNDFNYKSLGSIIEDFVDCRYANCNFVLNIGMKKDGTIKPIEKAMFGLIGDWIKYNKSFIYNVKPAKDVSADNAIILCDSKYYYAVIKNVTMSADPNVAINKELGTVTINTDKRMVKPIWLDNNKHVKVKDNTFAIEPFFYGNSGVIRIMRFELI